MQAIQRKATPRLSDKQCLNIALRMRLFAAEAEKMGLSKDAAPGKQEAMTVARMKALSDLYTAKLLDGYPLKDVVIESYYWAHPEKFREKNETKDGAGNLKPMDAETKKVIRRIILSSKAIEIEKEAFERLMKNYHVKITDGTKGAANE